MSEVNLAILLLGIMGVGCSWLYIVVQVGGPLAYCKRLRDEVEDLRNNRS